MIWGNGAPPGVKCSDVLPIPRGIPCTKVANWKADHTAVSSEGRHHCEFRKVSTPTIAESDTFDLAAIFSVCPAVGSETATLTNGVRLEVSLMT